MYILNAIPILKENHIKFVVLMYVALITIRYGERRNWLYYS